MAVLKSKPKGSVANNVLAIICREAPKVFNDPSYTWAVGLLLWSVEIVLNVFIIYRVKCKLNLKKVNIFCKRFIPNKCDFKNFRLLSKVFCQVSCVSVIVMLLVRCAQA